MCYVEVDLCPAVILKKLHALYYCSTDLLPLDLLSSRPQLCIELAHFIL